MLKLGTTADLMTTNQQLSNVIQKYEKKIRKHVRTNIIQKATIEMMSQRLSQLENQTSISVAELEPQSLAPEDTEELVRQVYNQKQKTGNRLKHYKILSLKQAEKLTDLEKELKMY